MPNGGSQAYLPHLRRLIDTVEGSFHSLWVPDHLMFDQADTPEALTLLSLLAGITTDLHLGTIVLGQSYRNPALLAKDGCDAATTLWRTRHPWHRRRLERG